MANDTSAAAPGWDLIVAKARLDSFTFDQMAAAVRSLRGEGRVRLALDLKATRFISLSAIQFLAATAKELAKEGGALALVAASDKTLRHFEIYGSLDHMRIEKSASSLAGPEGEGSVRRHDLPAHGAPADSDFGSAVDAGPEAAG